MSNLYEFVRYPGKPYPQTHPERLATMAALHGMQPSSIYTARVLEIGCCDGGNLIPMALSLPKAEFVGIDLTETDIGEARQTAADLALTNIQFHVMDLTVLPGPLGQFDYIIVHGLYSWVPDVVREKMLAVIQASLTPRGVAFVSYNAQPGGHVRQMVRDMMLFHVGDVREPGAKIARAREFLEFLWSAWERNFQDGLIRKQVDLLRHQSDHSLFHDDLADYYQPVYLHEFASHAARYSLQYLSESSYFVTRPENLGSEAGPAFANIVAGFGGNPVPAVQYLDFIRCAYFHQSLVCQAGIALERTVRPERLKPFFFYSPSKALAMDAGSGEETFEGVQGSRITTSSPFVRALNHALIDAYPRSLHYSGLPAHGISQEELCGTLLALMNMGMIAASLHAPEFSVFSADRPVASPLARWQTARSRTLTDLRHSRTAVQNDLQRALLPLLDGTRTRAELLEELPSALSATPELLDEALLVLGQLCLLVS